MDSSNYTPGVGDIVVHEATSGHSHGRLDIFCYPAKDIPEDIRLIRSAGQGSKMTEFKYDNLTKNNDYVLFLDKISPSRKKREKDTKEEMEEKTDFMLYDLREKRDSIFQQKMTYWKSKRSNIGSDN